MRAPSYISSDGSWIVFFDFRCAGSILTAVSTRWSVIQPPIPFLQQLPQMAQRFSSPVITQSSERNEESGFFPHMIYVVCPVSCSSGPGTEIPIQNVSWTAASKLKDQVKLDGEITITTVGAEGGASQARVSPIDSLLHQARRRKIES